MFLVNENKGIVGQKICTFVCVCVRYFTIPGTSNFASFLMLFLKLSFFRDDPKILRKLKLV